MLRIQIISDAIVSVGYLRTFSATAVLLSAAATALAVQPLVVPPPIPKQAKALPALPTPPVLGDSLPTEKLPKAAPPAPSQPPPAGSRTFLSGAEIQKARALCTPLKSPASSALSIDHTGGRITLDLGVTAGSPCLSAVQSGESWLDAKMMGDRGLDITVGPNRTQDERRARITVLGSKGSLELVLTQQGDPNDYQPLE